MRVSERHRYDITTSRVENAKSNNAKMLEQMSTQKMINHLSDGPVNNAQVIRKRGRVSQSVQFKKNISYAKSYLERAESALSAMSNSLIRAKELSIAMANDTYGPQSRASTAEEIREIIDGIVSLGNTSFGNRFIFGGFRTQTPPLSLDGKFLGDDGGIYLQVSEGSFKKINLNSRNLFEASDDERKTGHFDMIHSLKILHQGLVDDDVPMIRTAMDELDYQLEKMAVYQAKVGAVQNTLESIRVRVENGEELNIEAISELEDADLFKTSSDFKRTESVLQSTLLASTKLLQPSLLNFLQ